MAKQVINFGTAINDGTGDPLRVGAQKINSNFTELYDLLGGSESISIVTKITTGPGLVASSAAGDITIRTLPASQTEPGSVTIGSGINVDEDGVISVTPYSLPKASTNILGGIKVGDNLSINNEGVLSAVATPYTLPTASPTVKGGVKIGNGLEVLDGVLNVTTSEIAAALQNGTATLQLQDAGETNGILKASGALNLLSGSDGVTDTNYMTLKWALDIDGVESSKNSLMLLSTSGVTLAVTDEAEQLKFWNFDHAGVLTIPATSEVAGWISATPGTYPMLLAGSNDGLNGGPELNWANNALGNDPFDANVTRNSMWINDSGVVFSIDANSESPTYWQFKTDKTTVLPGTLTLTGDPSSLLSGITSLENYIAGRQSLIAPLESQLTSLSDQLIYWEGILAQGPSNPLFDQALALQSSLLGQISSIQSQISGYNAQIASAQSFIDGYETQLEVITVTLSVDPVSDALIVEGGLISGTNSISLKGRDQLGSTTGGDVNIQAGSSQLGSGGVVRITGAPIYANQISSQGNVEITGGNSGNNVNRSAGDVVIKGGVSGVGIESGDVFISGGGASSPQLGSNGGNVSITGGYRYGAGPVGFDEPGDSQAGAVYIGQYYTRLVQIGGAQSSTVSISTGNNYELFDQPDQVWEFDTNGRIVMPTTSIAPATSTGTTGDKAGMFAIDASYIYYCTADYTDGIADIWKRTAHGTGTW